MEPQPPFDSKLQRRILGCFATGITVVTTAGKSLPAGLTANAIASLSLDPPLVLVAVDRRAGTLPDLKQNGCFALNILTEAQEHLSRRFATPGPKDFSDLEVSHARTGAPILAGVLAWVDCQITEFLPGGDHEIVIGQIVAGDLREGRPLLYYRGAYSALRSAP